MKRQNRSSVKRSSQAGDVSAGSPQEDSNIAVAANTEQEGHRKGDSAQPGWVPRAKPGQPDAYLVETGRDNRK